MQNMNPAFLSPKQSRILNAKQQKQKQTFRLISELLLQHGFPEALCRELLNGRQLFSKENQQAARILSEALPSFFKENHSLETPEPISFEGISFTYQFLSQSIPPNVKHLLLDILQQRNRSLQSAIEAEGEVLQNLQTENQIEIDAIDQSLSKNYRFALLLFLVISSGIFVLFLGFYTVDYLLVLLGLVLTIPSLFITENPSGFVQFRKDRSKQVEISSLKKQIQEQRKIIAALQKKQADVLLKKRQLEAELRPPNPA